MLERGGKQLTKGFAFFFFFDGVKQLVSFSVESERWERAACGAFDSRAVAQCSHEARLRKRLFAAVPEAEQGAVAIGQRRSGLVTRGDEEKAQPHIQPVNFPSKRGKGCTRGRAENQRSMLTTSGVDINYEHMKGSWFCEQTDSSYFTHLKKRKVAWQGRGGGVRRKCGAQNAPA